jgi:hypothetical protein
MQKSSIALQPKNKYFFALNELSKCLPKKMCDNLDKTEKKLVYLIIKNLEDNNFALITSSS